MPPHKGCRRLLISFYKNAGGDDWTRRDHWPADQPESDDAEWFGVKCNEGGDVISLILPENNVTGDIGQLRFLKQLERLDLRGNSIRGEFPSSLGQLKALKYLDLSHNHFVGPLPESLGSLEKSGSLEALETLRIGHNSFSGPIPPDFVSELPLLKSLDWEQYGTDPQVPDKIVERFPVVRPPGRIGVRLPLPQRPTKPLAVEPNAGKVQRENGAVVTVAPRESGPRENLKDSELPPKSPSCCQIS